MTFSDKTRSIPMAIDPATSLEAAASQSDSHVTAVQEHIVAILRDGPLTDDAIREAYEGRVRTHGAPPASPSSLRSRRSELCRRGVASATKLQGRSAWGRPATVWALTIGPKQTSCLV